MITNNDLLYIDAFIVVILKFIEFNLSSFKTSPFFNKSDTKINVNPIGSHWIKDLKKFWGKTQKWRKI